MADNAKKVIRLEYKAYLADEDRLYDTTDEAAAKEANIYSDKVKYAPMAYIVGSNKLFPALDKAIAAAKVGEEFTVEVPAEEGAGARNPKLIEVHSAKEFYREQINPMVGMTVTLGGRPGIVTAVGAGRVRVDFNNQLAGHDLKYVMKISEEITDNNKPRPPPSSRPTSATPPTSSSSSPGTRSSSPSPRLSSSTRPGSPPGSESSPTSARRSASTPSSSSRSGRRPRRTRPPRPTLLRLKTRTEPIRI
jgi:FKBP-type peptidyl-prolyl cis-trans isomerase 2